VGEDAQALGVLRSQLGQPLLQGKENEWQFLWVREFPISSGPRRQALGAAPPHVHHAHADTWSCWSANPGKVYAQLYDVVLNGTELGSGSIPHPPHDIQER